MSVEDQGARARAAIETTFRERRAGFLAWARGHAPDDETAEEALQDAFLRALDNARALNLVDDVAGWIFSVLRNRLVDLWRGRKARERAGAVDLPAETLQEIADAAGVDPHDELERDEMEDALRIALAALPREQQVVLRAQALGGVGFREMAEQTGVSINTLMARKRRAVRKLAAALEYWMED